MALNSFAIYSTSMRIIKQRNNTHICPTGNCPPGVDEVKKIALSPTEKRAIFFVLKQHIFKQKQLIRNIPLF